jgi:hypothetical protein
MTRARYILLSLALALAAALACARAWSATDADKDNYERLLAIYLTGNAENRATAHDALRGMGDAGIELMKADCEKPDSIRGALAWSLLKEFLLQTDPETLRDFARKNLLDLARDWNNGYKNKADRAKQARLKDLVDDYVVLLLASDKPRDFELLMRSLKFSLIASDTKVEFGAEFEVWKRIWEFLNERIAITESLRDLQNWQATLDDHFRRYSLMKGYADRKAIQAYHTTTLLLMQRIDAVKKKPKPEPAPDAKKPAEGAPHD